MAKPAGDWVADQIDAATADMTKRWAQIPTTKGVQERGAGQVAMKLVQAVKDAVPSATTCKHLKSPKPCFLQAHQPGHYLCGVCMMMANARTKGTPEDDICDGCRQHTDLMTPAVVHLGLVVMALGLCPSCDLLDRASNG